MKRFYPVPFASVRIAVLCLAGICLQSGAVEDAAKIEDEGHHFKLTNKTDIQNFITELEGLTKTNLVSAVNKCDPSRIDEIYKLMGKSANTPMNQRQNWGDLEFRLVKIQFQIVQALHTMRLQRKMSNPLSEIKNEDGTYRYDAWTTKPEDIDDPELRKKYLKWRAFLRAHPGEVSRDNKIETMYRHRMMMLYPWAWDDKYVPMIKETVKDKELLDQFLDPALNPRPTVPKGGEN